MWLNDFFARTTGLRVVPDTWLNELKLRHHRRATDEANREAISVVEIMARHNGRPLSPALKKRADAYAVDVLGSPDYAPWLQAYAAFQGRFEDGWMPDNFYHLKVVPRISDAASVATVLKSFTNVVLKTEALPDLAYHIGGVFYDRDFAVIDRAALLRLAAPFGHVFVKPDGGWGGKGVEKIAAAAIADHAFADNCVLQRPIRQHPWFDDLSPQSVATLRITTARDPQGAIGARGAFLRLGRAGSDCVTAEESMDVAVLDSEGTLDELGYMGDWRALSTHPDTGVRLKGRKLAHFSRAAELCRGLHVKVPHLPMIGWDVAVNCDDQIELMEWNGGHCDIKFCEAVSGPHFRDMGWERFAAPDARGRLP